MACKGLLAAAMPSYAMQCASTGTAAPERPKMQECSHNFLAIGVLLNAQQGPIAKDMEHI